MIKKKSIDVHNGHNRFIRPRYRRAVGAKIDDNQRRERHTVYNRSHPC